MTSYSQTDPKKLTEKGISLAKEGKYEEAIALYDHALELDDDSCVETMMNKCLALHNLERYHEACMCIADALELDPSYVNKFTEDYLTDEANSYYSYNCNEGLFLDCPDASITWPYMRSIHVRWLYEHGYALYNSGKSKESIKYFDKAIKLDPDNADVWEAKGNALDKLDKSEEAQKCYGKAKQLH